MDSLRALILGAVQGATEFLPVSSSGHLKLGQSLLGLTEPQLLFDIVLHVGTLVSVMIFYRADVLMAIQGMWRGVRDGASERSLDAFLKPEGMRLAILIILSTLPTGVIGILFKKVLDPDDGSSPITPTVVCGLLIINGLILMSNAYFLKREERTPEAERPVREGRLDLWRITPLIALGIGLAQGLAVLPGISRSGMTITIALALMVQRMHAARYSFLLSIPAILGALVLKLGDMQQIATHGDQLGIFIGGALCAAVVGYLCLVLLTRMLQHARFHHFAWYCWAVGIAGLIFL